MAHRLAAWGGTLTESHRQLIEIVRQRGLRHFAEPVTLASGEESRHFVDGKTALSAGAHLRLACQVLHDRARDLGISYEAVGGLTMGADQFAHGLAVLYDCDWLVIRKEPKRRGTNKLIEGSEVGAGKRVLLVDDVVSTGGSIQVACERVIEAGAEVVGAATLVDRGDMARPYFEQRDIPYFALVTYQDLGIPPVGEAVVPA